MLTFALFALTLGTLFSAVTLWVYYRVEDRMFQRRLEEMIDTPGNQRPLSISFVGAPDQAPEPYRHLLDGLPPGYYEWEKGGSETHVLVSAGAAGGPARVAMMSFGESESSQAVFGLALFIGVAVTSLLALGLARYLAMRIVSPIELLTRRLATGPPDRLMTEELTRRLKDDEVATLARALDRAGSELQASAERERRFLREASHELRTPITIIQGVSDLLRESVQHDDELTHRRLDRLQRSLRRMHTSVLSLLAMARAEHRQMIAAGPPIAQQLSDLLEEMEAIGHGSVEIESELLAEPRCAAPSMLILVLANLVRNAVVHAAPGRVTVRVDSDQATVSDQGPGLSPTILEQLKGDGPKPDLGIGLATVTRICHRFDWQLDARSPEAGGCSATIYWSSRRARDGLGLSDARQPSEPVRA
ncbi:MAG: HAMP domain-containing sensor histidine kinase [Acidobacteriota bacterium]